MIRRTLAVIAALIASHAWESRAAARDQGYPAVPLLSTETNVVGETLRYPTSGAAHVTAAVVTLAPGQRPGGGTDRGLRRARPKHVPVHGGDGGRALRHQHRRAAGTPSGGLYGRERRRGCHRRQIRRTGGDRAACQADFITAAPASTAADASAGGDHAKLGLDARSRQGPDAWRLQGTGSRLLPRRRRPGQLTRTSRGFWTRLTQPVAIPEFLATAELPDDDDRFPGPRL